MEQWHNHPKFVFVIDQDHLLLLFSHSVYIVSPVLSVCLISIVRDTNWIPACSPLSCIMQKGSLKNVILCNVAWPQYNWNSFLAKLEILPQKQLEVLQPFWKQLFSLPKTELKKAGGERPFKIQMA